MKENIVKNGARVISFAPDDESTNVLGTVTDSYKVNTTINYDIRTDDQKEDLLDLIFQNIQIQLSLYKNQEIQSRKRNVGMENLETS